MRVAIANDAVSLELGRGDRIVAVDAESAKRPGLARRARVPETDDEAFLLLTALERGGKPAGLRLDALLAA